MSALLFGQSQVVITPPFGTLLVGYPERDHGCEGVHDDLYAKVWAFSDGRQEAVLAFLDLAGLDRETTRRVRDRVAAAVQTSPRHIHLNYTHSHSAPASFPAALDNMYQPAADPVLEETLVRHIAGAILVALRSLRPGRLGFGMGHLAGICSNRRDPAKPSDQEVAVVRIEEADGHLAGVIMKYACHPTVLSQDNYLVSRDFPGYACDAVATIMGNSVQVAYGQGTAADTSTRWTRRGNTFAEAERMGTMLAGEVLRVLEGIETSPELELKCASRELAVPTRKFPSVAEAEQRLSAERDRLERLHAAGAPYGQVRTLQVAAASSWRSSWAGQLRDPSPLGRGVEDGSDSLREDQRS